MAQAQAELIISPEIARDELKKTLRNMEREFAAMNKKIEKGLESSVSGGISKGGVVGSARLKKYLGRAKTGAGAVLGVGDAVGSLKGALSGGLIGTALFGLFDAMNRADMGKESIDAMLSDKDAMQQKSLASGLDMSTKDYARLSTGLSKAGMEDTDIRQLFTDIKAKVQESLIPNGDQKLSEFNGYRGADLMNRFFASYAEKSNAEQIQIADELGWNDQQGQLQTFTQTIDKGNAADTLKELSTMYEEAATSEASRIEREAKLEKEYADSMGEINRLHKERMLSLVEENQLLPARVESQKRELKRQEDIFANYDSNQKTANDIRDGMQLLANGINTGTKGVTDSLNELADSLRFAGVLPSETTDNAIISSPTEFTDSQRKFIDSF